MHLSLTLSGCSSTEAERPPALVSFILRMIELFCACAYLICWTKKRTLMEGKASLALLRRSDLHDARAKPGGLSLASPDHSDPESRTGTYSGKDPFAKKLTITPERKQGHKFKLLQAHNKGRSLRGSKSKNDSSESRVLPNSSIFSREMFCMPNCSREETANSEKAFPK